jgi:phosphoribosylamine-glycine ligase
LVKSYVSIIKDIIKIIKRINWKRGFFRRDIGWRVIKS